jgi:hypothetical protein
MDYSVFVESEAIVVTPFGGTAITVEPDLGVARSERGLPLGKGAGSSSAVVLEVEEVCELHTQYSIVVRRAPEDQVVAACELLSPTNKGVHGPEEKDKYLRKRERYLQAGVNLLEIDALLGGERLIPRSLASLEVYKRSAWSALHRGDRRRLRAWGWNDEEPLPAVAWGVEAEVEVTVDLGATLQAACDFNPWERLAGGNDGLRRES